ncbi:hypothetical protein GCM10010174_85030 [Kutzneria viridogrisea]|uniref:Gamma-glutamylcyclotransferase (GGCT)/AIG2-like uncharacterized protein YtfP n=1 Tax=Kutzneria viridogrisea TaxID=47990 RepID=A0ABR6BWI2_9PSEU|nr:gamma-glutamylcyclotransferase (GGCT)/AIG2-like uncharacterized protein YtfP [Kutzneria viridogrisea]
MRRPFRDEEYPAAPYPGARPDVSFVHLDGVGLPLSPARGLAGWRVDSSGEDLDDWLAARGAVPLADRVPVLAYGSNACPSKITWLRESLGLTGPVVALRARCEGLSAVWAAGLRVVDDQRPATLMAAPGVVEEHAVWLASPDQVRVLDTCEGRGRRYRLAGVRSGRVLLEDGAVVDRVLAYVAASRIRRPLLAGGKPVRCAEVSQADARELDGRRSGPDGLRAATVRGIPHPNSWPARVFVYGTLQPGGRAWRLIRPMVVGRPRPVRVPGTLYDTGLGYPALRLGGSGEVPGAVLTLRDPAACLPVLDEYEGEQYRRVRVTLPDGEVCWTYVWIEAVRGMRVLAEGWA